MPMRFPLPTHSTYSLLYPSASIGLCSSTSGSEYWTVRVLGNLCRLRQFHI